MKNRTVFFAAFATTVVVASAYLYGRSSAPPEPATPASRMKLFSQVLQHVREDYVDALPDSALYRRAVDGTLNELNDPHSVFLDPRPLDRLEERTEGHYAGVGIQMDVRDSGFTVTATLPGSSAEQLGVMPGDRVVSIDGRATRSIPSEEISKSLRGAVGTKVAVLLDRPGASRPVALTLVRTQIEVNPVAHSLIVADGIGLVALTIFSTKAADDLTLAIDSLQRAGARSLILDLRGDPGGLLEVGVSVSDLFLDPGQPIVSMLGRQPAEKMRAVDKTPQRWPAMPVIVLVDSNSASASEIVAGALQDHDRALIVGTTTYGKGSAQRVFRFDGGAVKLTTALWYTPRGRSIDRRRRLPSTDDGAARTVSDSTRPKFSTDAGRTMLGGGGIVPDVEVFPRSATEHEKAFQRAIGSQGRIFRAALESYATSLRDAKAVTSPAFDVTPEMHAKFYSELSARGVVVPRVIYDSASALVTRVIAARVARVVFGRTAEYTRQLRDDPIAMRAVELARGARTQQELLSHVLPATK